MLPLAIMLKARCNFISMHPCRIPPPWADWLDSSLLCKECDGSDHFHSAAKSLGLLRAWKDPMEKLLQLRGTVWEEYGTHGEGILNLQKETDNCPNRSTPVTPAGPSDVFGWALLVSQYWYQEEQNVHCFNPPKSWRWFNKWQQAPDNELQEQVTSVVQAFCIFQKRLVIMFLLSS